MKDFKYLSKSFQNLHQEIHKTFSELNEIKLKKEHKKALPLSIVLGAAVLFAISFVFIKSIVYSSDSLTQEVLSYSFIGNVKLEQEFHDMENPFAMGGDDLQSAHSRDTEPQFYFYRVQQGESIYSISRKMGMSMDSLVSLNSMDNAHRVSVNDKLIIPTVPGILYTVKSGDTIKKIAEKYSIDVDDIISANEMNSDTINAGDVLFLPGAQFTAEERALIYGYIFIKPIHGRFTSSYGYRRDPFSGQRRFHAGIDIAAPTGTSVGAAKEGTIIFAGWRSGYGKCIIIKHQFGYSTVYGHLSSISVRVGQWVSQGQTIGRVGSTGRSTGPHLHFEVLKFGVHTNPLSYDGLHRGSGIWY